MLPAKSGIEPAHERLVRLVYIDESGTCDASEVLLLAAVIIHGDRHYRAIESDFKRIKAKYLKPEHRHHCFRATDIYSATGPIFRDRNSYTVADRCAILKALLSIPSKLGLSVVFGFSRKEAERSTWSKRKKSRRLKLSYETAFAFCCLEAEEFLTTYTPNEIAKIIVEDSQAAQGIRGIYNSFRGVRKPPGTYTVLHKIVDAMSVENKDDAPVLQLADTCAFTLRYFIEKRNGMAQFIAALSPKGAEGIKVFEYSDAIGSGRIFAPEFKL